MLYLQGINNHLWYVIRSMYFGLTARVKWEGEFSPTFSVLQGVRQGGILSTLYFYKAYLNDSLLELETRALGKFIGTLYMGCPTVADDVLLMASSDGELQLMFNLAYINTQEKRYVSNPQKTTAQRRNVSKADSRSEIVKDWFIGLQKVKGESKLSNLGLTRTENSINIAERISTTRRTLYALIKTGVHGTSGLNPKISYKIYKVYVIYIVLKFYP